MRKATKQCKVFDKTAAEQTLEPWGRIKLEPKPRGSVDFSPPPSALLIAFQSFRIEPTEEPIIYECASSCSYEAAIQSVALSQPSSLAGTALRESSSALQSTRVRRRRQSLGTCGRFTERIVQTVRISLSGLHFPTASPRSSDLEMTRNLECTHLANSG